MERVYDQLEMDGFGELEPALVEYFERKKNHQKKSVYALSLRLNLKLITTGIAIWMCLDIQVRLVRVRAEPIALLLGRQLFEGVHLKRAQFLSPPMNLRIAVLHSHFVPQLLVGHF